MPEGAAITLRGVGLLARPQDPQRTRLDLRQVLDGHTSIAALRDFEPSLPWVIFRVSRRPIRALVMHAFGRDLGRRPAAG